MPSLYGISRKRPLEAEDVLFLSTVMRKREKKQFLKAAAALAERAIVLPDEQLLAQWTKDKKLKRSLASFLDAQVGSKGTVNPLSLRIPLQ